MTKCLPLLTLKASEHRCPPTQPVLFSYVTSFLSSARPLAFYFRPQGLLGRADGTRRINGLFLQVPLESQFPKFLYGTFYEG